MPHLVRGLLLTACLHLFRKGRHPCGIHEQVPMEERKGGVPIYAGFQRQKNGFSYIL